MLSDTGSMVSVGELSISNIGILDSSSNSTARPVSVAVDSVDFSALRSAVHSAWKTETAVEVDIACSMDSTLYAYHVFPVPMPAIKHSFKQTIDLRAAVAQVANATATPAHQQGYLRRDRPESPDSTEMSVSSDGDALLDPVYARPSPGYAHSFHGWEEGKQYIQPAATAINRVIDAMASVKVVDNTIIIPVHYLLGVESKWLPSSVEEAIVHVPAICYFVGDDISSVQWSMCAAAFDVDLVAAEVALDTTVTINCANLDPSAESSSCGALLPYLVMRQDFLKNWQV